ncbi:MAG: hypothetical protein IKW51_08780 [Bacteroidales bacterium]|nr:hypothetical protein [Bacteroidales bacterium]
MKQIYIVLDADNNRAIKAFVDENKADDYATDYYYNKGIDTRVDTVWFDETE